MSKYLATKIHDMFLIQYATDDDPDTPVLKLIGPITDIFGVNQIKAATWLSLAIDEVQIAEYITRKFNDYTYLGLATDDPTAEFIRDFNLNAELRSQSTATLIASFMGDYNPIENYDLYSSESTGNSSDLITSKSMPRGLGDSSSKVETVNSEATYTSPTKDISKSVSDLVEMTNTVQTNKTLIRETENGSLGKEYGNISDHDKHEHGNMGVSTVTDMIKKEMDVRLLNFVYELIDSICGDILVQIGDGE